MLLTGDLPKAGAAGGVRPLEPDDLEQVTKMFVHSFRGDMGCRSGDLKSYFHRVYFENPWLDDQFPSLVLDQGGIIEGFLGVIPRRMRFHGRPIHVSVASAMMVKLGESGKRNPIVAARLLRRFFEGKQDLSLTDTANEITKGIWTACGGSIAFPYSYSWTRPLKPLNTILNMGIESPLFRSLLRPLCGLGDLLLGNIPPLSPVKPKGRLEPMDGATLLELMSELPQRSLVPDYDLASLEWLLSTVQPNRSSGTLTQRTVRDASGKRRGWFVYDRNEDGFGRVLQLAAQPRCMDLVLDALIFEARRQGLTALWGRTEPEHTSLLTQRHCIFQGRPWCLVHASQPEIVQCLQNADAFFSGLDGELWMKFNA